MGIQIREAKSEEMQKNIRTVKQMTKGMGFDENMGKATIGTGTPETKQILEENILFMNKYI